MDKEQAIRRAFGEWVNEKYTPFNHHKLNSVDLAAEFAKEAQELYEKLLELARK